MNSTIVFSVRLLIIFIYASSLSESREMITAKDEAQRECQHEQEHEHQGLINIKNLKSNFRKICKRSILALIFHH